jgi:hypothetical protein
LVQMRVPAYLEGRYGDLIERLMAAAGEEGHREYREPREPSEVLEWRVGSFTTSERRVHRICDLGRSLAHTSELQGRS